MPHDHKAGHTTAGHHYQECIDACFSCSEICNACSDDMIGMEGHGKKEVGNSDGTVHSALPRLRRCCLLSAALISRNSSFAEQFCRLCAEVCDSCAETCEAHAPHHAMCGDCAKECRRCADLCREMEGAKA